MAEFSGWKCEKVKDRTLKSALNHRCFQIHVAAIDWSLADPIIINDEKDIKATNWRSRGLEPFHHQVQNLITFCRRLPVTLNCDDVGLGKTISAGLALSELISRKKVRRALVLCPKVLTTQWVGELESKFGIQAVSVAGRDFSDEIKSETQVVVTTYQTASNRLAEIEDDDFQLLILDEAHKLRNLYGAISTPQVAKNVRRAMEKRPFKYILMLTATPIQNKVWDLYSLIDILKTAEGKANPLGNKEYFKNRYILPGSNGRKLNPGMQEEFRRITRENLTRTSRTEVQMGFPKRKLFSHPVRLDFYEKQVIKLVSTLISSLDRISQLSLLQAMMSSPAAMVKQAGNMAQRGTLEQDVARDISKLASSVKVPGKLAALLEMVEEIRSQKPDGWRLVVFTLRIETLEMLGRELSDRGIKVGFVRGARHAQNTKTIADYQSNPPAINVIISTEAGAEGINLQAGNVLVNYDLPWNPMVVEQRIGRVQRLSSIFENVFIYNLIATGTTEELVVGILMEKLQGIAQAIGDIETILEMTNMDAEEGPGSFEDKIRELVVASMLEKDITAERQALEENIARAKLLYEEKRNELDAQLGGNRDRDRPIKRLGMIRRDPPAMTAPEFVLSAKEAEGFKLNEVSEDIYDVTRAGRFDERISLKEGMVSTEATPFNGDSRIKTYLPGRPSFDRLVENWTENHGHYLFELKGESLVEQTLKLIEKWCFSSGNLDYESHSIVSEKPDFTGRAHIKAKAGTGVDSFEKVIHQNYGFQSGEMPEELLQTGKRIVKSIRASELLGTQFQEKAAEAIERDDGIRQFCDFYLGRLEEEIGQTNGDRFLKAKLISDLNPVVQGEILGIEGLCHPFLVIGVSYRVDGVTYKSTISGFPATGTLIEQPEQQYCSITDKTLPSDCLDTCQYSGELGLAHRLVKSESGLTVRPSLLEPCSETGTLLLPNERLPTENGTFARKDLFLRGDFGEDYFLPKESAFSEISGLRGRASRLIISPISGRGGFQDEAVKCKATGRFIFYDEAVQSDSTSAWFGKDTLIRSAVSGIAVTPDDAIICSVSGRYAVPSEIPRCAVSGKYAFPEHMVPSAATGSLLLPEHGVKTEPGEIAEPDQVGICSVTGKRYLLKNLGRCEVSGLHALTEHLDKSQVSGRLALPEKMISSSITGIRGLPSEFSKCDVTGLFALQEELERCAISGRLVCPDQLVESAATGLRILPNEGIKITSGLYAEKIHVATCVVTGQVRLKRDLAACEASLDFVCPEYLVKSDYSDKKALPENLVVSEISGKRGLPLEMTECSKSGRKASPDELVASSISGKLYCQEVLVKSAATGQWIAPEEGAPLSEGRFAEWDKTRQCAVTGDNLLLNEAGYCQVSGKRVRPDLLIVSEITGRMALAEYFTQSAVSGIRGLRGEFETCQKTGRFALKKELLTCSESFKKVCPDQLVTSAVTGSLLLPEKGAYTSDGKFAEAVNVKHCAISQKLFLKTELDKCAVSGLLVQKDLLVASEGCGRMALPDRMVVSQVSGKRVLPYELIECQKTKTKALPDELETSSVTGRKYLPEVLVQSAATGKWLLPEEGQQLYDGRYAEKEKVLKCQKTGRNALPSDLELCTLTGFWACKDLMRTSIVTGKRILAESGVCLADGRFVEPNHAGTCEISGKKVLRSELSVCMASTKLVLKQNLDRCEISGLMVCLDLLKASVISGKRGLANKMVWCESKNGWLLPVEAIKLGETEAKTRLIPEEKGKNTAGVNQEQEGNRIVTEDGKTGLRSEVARCFWDGKIYLIKDFAECTLTKVKVFRGHLNEKSELVALRQFLSKEILGEPVSNELCVKIRSNQLLQGVNSATARRLVAPSKAAYILKFIERNNLNVKLNLAVIISTKDGGERLKGRVIVVEKKR